MTTLRNLKVKHFLIDINITKADKEGAVVILDIKDYIDKANRQLNDTVLDITVFKEDNKLRTKVNVKPTDMQSYLQRKLEHRNSTKKCIAYSQALRFNKSCYNRALRFNKICYNRSDLNNNCKLLLKTLTKRGYNKTDTTTQINRAISIPRNESLNKIKASNTEHLPLTVTYNSILPNLATIIDENLHTLQIEPKRKEIFAEGPILRLKRNKNLKDIIGGNKVFGNRKFLNVTKGNANHVSRDQLTYVVNNSKLDQPFKVSLTKAPF